ncbi:hypothetical protein [Pseudomonas cerasi]|nr:hypothetical protein [Pseudomonas cerasi]
MKLRLLIHPPIPAVVLAVILALLLRLALDLDQVRALHGYWFRL